MRAAVALTLVLAACAQQPRQMNTATAFTVLQTPLEFDIRWAPSAAWRGESATQQFLFYDLISGHQARPGQVRVQYVYPKEGQAAPLASLTGAAAAAQEIARVYSTPVAAAAPVTEVRNAHGTAYLQLGPQGTLWCGWAVQNFDEARGIRVTSCRSGQALGDQTQVREDLREVLAGMRVRPTA